MLDLATKPVTSHVQVYSDETFLAALQGVQSKPVRALAVRLDSIAVFLRLDVIDPDEAADELNAVGLTLLELATAKQRKAVAA